MSLDKKQVEVTPSGIKFGGAWYSYEHITGFTADQLNSGNCSLTARQFMKWLNTPDKEGDKE